MDLMSYSTMDTLPFQHQNQHLFDFECDEAFEMEQLLAAAFDSSSDSSLELFQCSSNEDDICFDPLYSVSDFFPDDINDVFLADDFFVNDKNAVFVDDHNSDVFVADDHKSNVFVADDHKNAVFVADDHKSNVFVADDAKNVVFADDHKNAVFVGADDKNAVFVGDDHKNAVFVGADNKNAVFVADDHKSDVFVADDHKSDVFVAEDEKNAFLVGNDDVMFQQNLFISPHCYQLGNQLNHPENSFNKRQRMSQNDGYNKRPCYYNNHDSNTFLHGLLPPPPPPPPPFHFSLPPVFNHGISTNKEEEESKILSAQSLSARQRRRKISEKTKELGKLVPGGQKMNTAEMFEAASSYIKFLQAQFAILQLMESSSSSLTPLIGSPLIQEKLYSINKCLIPKGLVESLENHKGIQSNSQISKDVRDMILTFC